MKIICGLCGKGLTESQVRYYGPTIVCQPCKVSLEGDVVKPYDGAICLACGGSWPCSCVDYDEMSRSKYDRL